MFKFVVAKSDCILNNFVLCKSTVDISVAHYSNQNCCQARMLWEQEHMDNVVVDATLNIHPRNPDEGGRIRADLEREQAREDDVLVQHIIEVGQQLVRAGATQFAPEDFRQFQIRLGIPGDTSSDGNQYRVINRVLLMELIPEFQ